jgi:hypothetical protein
MNMKPPSKTKYLFALAIISIVLTVYGSILKLPEIWTWEKDSDLPWGKIFDFLLVAVAQLTLNGFDVLAPLDPGSFWIRLGRFAALLFVVIAAGTLLDAIFNFTSSVRLFFTKQSSHDLVIGLGWHGQELLSKDSKRGAYKRSVWQRIRLAADTIAVDPRPEELARVLCKTKGIPLLETDALSKNVPALVGLHKVNRIFIGAGSDEVNIEIAFVLVGELVKKETNEKIVVAVNLQARKSFETLRGLIGNKANIDLHMFANTVSTAQALFSDANYKIDRFSETPSKEAHLVLIGDDLMAVELLRSTLQYSFFEKDASLAIDVLCPKAQEFSRRWSEEYPCYTAVPAADSMPKGVYELTPPKIWLDEKVLPTLRFHELPESVRGQIDWCEHHVNPVKSVTTVILAMRDPSDSSEITESIGAKLTDLAQEGNCEIWVYCNSRNEGIRNSLASKLKVDHATLNPKVFFDYMGKFSQEIACEEYTDEVAKRVNAMWAIKDAHIENKSYKGILSQQEIDEQWNVDGVDKDSSRQSAVHAYIKRRVKQRLAKSLGPSDVQLALAEIEHRRWCAEYLLKGFVPLASISADGTLTADQKSRIDDWYNGKKANFKRQRLHACLVPYYGLVTLLGEERGEDEQKKDHRIVVLLEWVLDPEVA